MDRITARVSHARIDRSAQASEGKTDSIRLELLVGGDLTPEQERRLREVADRCPVHRALTGQVLITHG